MCLRFSDRDLNDLFHVLDAAAAVDGSVAVVLSDNHHPYNFHHQQQFQQQNYYGGSSYGQQQLTRLQDEILQCLETVERETLLFNDKDCVKAPATVADNVSAAYNDRDRRTGVAETTLEQRRSQRQQLVQRFLCPLFDQLLKFCRFVCPPPPSGVQVANADNRQTLTNGGAAAIDHFYHHNKVCIIKWLVKSYFKRTVFQN